MTRRNLDRAGTYAGAVLVTLAAGYFAGHLYAAWAHEAPADFFPRAISALAYLAGAAFGLLALVGIVAQMLDSSRRRRRP